jgi:hypothetical protein
LTGNRIKKDSIAFIIDWKIFDCSSVCGPVAVAAKILVKTTGKSISANNVILII